MKKSLAVFALAISIAIAAPWLRAQAQPPAAVPVVVELFTSEGCSSCPPADDVLTQLMATQPVPGVHIIALGEHVDFWDHKGWRDPFSSPAFSRRQEDYAKNVLRGGNLYTPQFVVNGEKDLVGSDYRAAIAAISASAKTAGRVHISLAVDAPAAATPAVAVRVDSADGAPLKKIDLWLAVIENGLTTQVARGENGGRTLQHTAVVRTLKAVAAIPAGSPTWSGSTAVTLAADWKRSALHLVAFAQDHSSRHVLGAADVRCD